MIIVGYIMIALGVALIMLGLAAAGLSLGRKEGQGMATPSTGFGELLQALPKIIEELSKAPKWLSLTLVGLLVLVLGVQLVDGGWPFSHAAAASPPAAAANATT